MLVGPNGELFSLTALYSLLFTLPCSATAFADKLGVDFALIHRKRRSKASNAPDLMELLVGDVRGKVN